MVMVVEQVKIVTGFGLGVGYFLFGKSEPLLNAHSLLIYKIYIQYLLAQNNPLGNRSPRAIPILRIHFI